MTLHSKISHLTQPRKKTEYILVLALFDSITSKLSHCERKVMKFILNTVMAKNQMYTDCTLRKYCFANNTANASMPTQTKLCLSDMVQLFP